MVIGVSESVTRE